LTPYPSFKLKGTVLLGSKEFIEELLPPKKAAKKQERNETMYKAHVDYGYTLSEIARHVRLHYATIGRIIKVAM